MSEVRRTSNGRTVRRLGVHVLGAADLDVTSPNLEAGIAKLEALPDDASRWEELTRPPQLTTPTEGRFAMRSLHAALEAGCDGLLLIATRQDPPDPLVKKLKEAVFWAIKQCYTEDQYS